jgi:hypothetical protein
MIEFEELVVHLGTGYDLLTLIFPRRFFLLPLREAGEEAECQGRAGGTELT